MSLPLGGLGPLSLLALEVLKSDLSFSLRAVIKDYLVRLPHVESSQLSEMIIFNLKSSIF